MKVVITRESLFGVIFFPLLINNHQKYYELTRDDGSSDQGFRVRCGPLDSVCE